jgi:hypothetical protein
MRHSGHMRMMLSAALATLSMPLSGRDRAELGKSTLDDIFTPRFDIGGSGRGRGAYRGAGQRHRTTDWRHGTQAKEAAKRVARGQAGDDRNWLERKAWLERNAHVVAKREADQAKAMGPDGGRNAIRWGRR